MADQKAIIVGISGCSSSGKTTLARLLRDIFPNTFILHEDDFYKAEDQLPIKDGLVDWDCPEAISFPDMEKALSHIRSTGTFPVSLLALDAPTLSHRHDHGFAQQPLSQSGGRRGAAAFVMSTASPIPSSPSSPSSNPSQSSATTGSTSTPFTLPPTSPSSTTSIPPVPQEKDEQALTISDPPPGPSLPKQPDLDSKEDQNTVGKCPVTESQILAAKQKVHEWLQPGHQGSLIFPPEPQNGQAQKDKQNVHRRAGPKICLLDGFLLYSPNLLPERLLTTLLDIKLFLLVSKEKATKRREARDGYVTLEGFWTDPPGYVEKIVWPNYVTSHAWLFQDGDVERGILNEGPMEKYGILAPVGKGMDVPFEETLDWAVDSIMCELERMYLGGKESGEREEVEKD